MRIKYEEWSPGADALQVIAQANAICRDYQRQGFDLTLRQLYYQFVSRDLIPNTQQSYKRLGDIINKARLAGLLDWDYIVDRTRNLRGNSHWTTPESIIRSAAASFAIDKWADQPRRVEVWVEKDALAGIVGRVAGQADVDYFACRGYVSQSELWSAAQRHMRYIAAGQGVTVLHLGDHDPSGIDMTRDIRDRLQNFAEVDWLNAHEDDFEGSSVLSKEIRAAMESWVGGDPIEVRRIALNYDQVEQYRPPPNPAKLTDSRASGYVRAHGYESWELDALDPTTLANLIRSHIDDIQEPDLYDDQLRAERHHRDLLDATSSRWGEVVDFLAGRADGEG